MGVPYKVSTEQRAEIVKRYLEGEKAEALAAEYEVTPQSIGHYAKKAGVVTYRVRTKITET